MEGPPWMRVGGALGGAGSAANQGAGVGQARAGRCHPPSPPRIQVSKEAQAGAPSRTHKARGWPYGPRPLWGVGSVDGSMVFTVSERASPALGGAGKAAPPEKGLPLTLPLWGASLCCPEAGARVGWLVSQCPAPG